jgi:hypothetical protein
MQSNKTLNKPSIIICACPHDACAAKLRELQAGMEEEGVPCLLTDDAGGDAAALAFKGAQVSPPGVGVGISPAALCVHYQKLPERQPLFVLERTGTPAEWRNFGYNAARLVKGLPFKDTSVQEEAAAPEDDMAKLYASVREIILKVLQESAQGHGEVNTWSKTL